jgi:hypothetical protein
MAYAALVAVLTPGLHHLTLINEPPPLALGCLAAVSGCEVLSLS